jgi:bifunctional DNA-binding transcriptional regulator/antitoxin component of YhaV-PrlF toxin-antitoxin module
MQPTGDLRVSERGQMSLPAAARHRWSLDDGGRVGYLDLGDALVIVPQGVDQLRHELLGAITDDVWAAAATGFGDRELAAE